MWKILKYLPLAQQPFCQQADVYAIDKLQRLNIAPTVLGDALLKISKGLPEKGAFEQLFSSHPSIKSRVEISLRANQENNL